ncbi:hypothetical protein GOV14_04390 [Candidatus Pacearchaeota archaeon]|nr:hypothetical protein [Candidatus Pacearchaeota archaeon]
MKKEKIKQSFSFAIIIFLALVLSFVLLLNLKVVHADGDGNVSIGVLGDGFWIQVSAPQNITYTFSTFQNYTIPLNVSSNRNVVSWNYTLSNGTIINESVPFSPNTTFQAVQGGNLLYVSGTDAGGNVRTETVYFEAFYNNSSPIIYNLNNELFVCEDHSLGYLYSGGYYFLVNNTDLDILQSSIRSLDISTGYFYINPEYTSGADPEVFLLFSSTLTSGNLFGVHTGSRTFEREINIKDYQSFPDRSDSQNVNFTLIEVNDLPNLLPIPVQTIWTAGPNSTFTYTVSPTDEEDGNLAGGNLNINLSFAGGEDLFTINTSTGLMNYTAKANDTDGGVSKVYDITICATDRGLLASHPSLGLCSATGTTPLSDCETFGLTITEQNRPPVIISYTPVNYTHAIGSTTNLYFSVDTYDPDGTIPDIYWLVDGVVKEINYSNSSDTFWYNFGCDTSGYHEVSVNVSDGLLNTSLTWNYTLSPVSCIVSGGDSSGGGGGGSPKILFCEELWGFEEWQQCVKLDDGYSQGLIDSGSMSLLKTRCTLFGWDIAACGFQIRKVTDVNLCGTNVSKPAVLRECQYSLDPTCSDGILNCHDDSCEIFVDCGGPCTPCPTCSDGVTNQGEKGIDCGGPCPACPVEIPVDVQKILFYIVFSLFLLISIGLIIFFVVRYNRTKKEFDRELQNKYKRLE